MANPPDYGFTSAPEPAQAAVSQGNGLAVAGLVLGIISLPCIILTFIDVPIAILAIIFGGVGVAKANKIGGKNKGMAIAGLIMGVIGLIGSVALIFWFMGEVKKELDRHPYRSPESMVTPAERGSVEACQPRVHAIVEHG